MNARRSGPNNQIICLSGFVRLTPRLLIHRGAGNHLAIFQRRRAMSIRLALMPFALAAALIIAVLGTAAVEAQQPPAPQITFRGGGQAIPTGDSSPRAADGTAFGPTAEGSSVLHVFVIGNSGSANLDVTDISAPTGFSVSAAGGLPASVVPGSALAIMVTCDAKAAGSYDGFLTVTSNDPDEDRAGFALSCRVDGVPEIDVAGNTIPIANGDTTPSTVDATDFGTTAAGTPVTHVFRVANRGVADLQVGTVSVPAGFTALNALPATIPSGSQADLQVRCDAATENSFGGNVTIANNDPDESPYVFRIRCVVGDNVPDFNPGPGDLPSSTATVVSPIVVPTPPQSGGAGQGGGDPQETKAPAGEQGGGSQVSTTIPSVPTSTPPRLVATPGLIATASAPSQGIFRPPSTGDAGLEVTHGSAGRWYAGAAVFAVAAVIAGIAGLKRARG
jgi:hypothetical protein